MKQLDLRLVAKVQSKAGSQIHALANLLQKYYFAVEEYNAAVEDGDGEAKIGAAVAIEMHETRLRKFVATGSL